MSTSNPGATDDRRPANERNVSPKRVAPPPYPEQNSGFPEPEPTGAENLSSSNNAEYQTQPYPAAQPYPVQSYQPAGQYNTTQPPYPAVVAAPRFGFTPMRTYCEVCQTDVLTTVTYKAGSMTWAICGITTCLACFLFPIALFGCCLIPFCVTSCKDVVHSCPKCQRQFARVSRW